VEKPIRITSVESEAIPAEHRKPVEDVLTVKLLFIRNLFFRARRLTSVLPGGFALSEIGSPPKTSGTMVEPELIHSKWQWAGANRFVTAAIFCHYKHGCDPSNLLAHLTWPPVVSTPLRKLNCAYTVGVSTLSLKSGSNFTRPSYARLKIVSPSGGGGRGRRKKAELGAWKGTTLKSTTTTTTTTSKRNEQILRLWLGPATFGYAIIRAERFMSSTCTDTHTQEHARANTLVSYEVRSHVSNQLMYHIYVTTSNGREVSLNRLQTFCTVAMKHFRM